MIYVVIAVSLQCRRQLLKKEEALAAAADKLADIDQHMHSLAAKYDKTLARLAEDRKAVASEAAERGAEESAVQRSREQALAAQAAAQEEQAHFDEQVLLHLTGTLLHIPKHSLEQTHLMLQRLPEAVLHCCGVNALVACWARLYEKEHNKNQQGGRLPLPDAV